MTDSKENNSVTAGEKKKKVRYAKALPREKGKARYTKDFEFFPYFRQDSSVYLFELASQS